MGRIFLITLEGKIYSCKHCQIHLALREDIISKNFFILGMRGNGSWPAAACLHIKKAFHCRHGKAYLFNKIANFTVGETEERMMMTGVHSVCDIFCVGCGSIVGWKYVAAQEKSQRYKEGKFILERFQTPAQIAMVAVKLAEEFLHIQRAELNVISAP